MLLKIEKELEDCIINNNASKKILKLLRSHDHHTSKSEIIKTFRLSVLNRLILVMEGIYPMLSKILGIKEFRRLAYSYLTKHVSTKHPYVLRGKNLADFINLYDQIQSIKYASDLARFEWLVYECYLAKEEIPFREDMLENLTKPDIKLSMRSSVKVLHSHYPIHNIISYIRSQDIKNIEVKDPNFKNLEPQEINLLLVRVNYNVNFILMSSLESHLLSLIQQKVPLDMIFVILLENFKINEDEIMKALERFLSYGVFTQY